MQAEEKDALWNSLQELPLDARHAYEVPTQESKGISVTNGPNGKNAFVENVSSAQTERAGVKKNQQLIAINGKSVLDLKFKEIVTLVGYAQTLGPTRLRFLKRPRVVEPDSDPDLIVFGLILVMVLVCGGAYYFLSDYTYYMSSSSSSPFELQWDSRNPKPETESVTLSITLKQVYLGSDIQFRPPRGIQKVCDACHGTGALHGDHHHIHTCPNCGGSGVEVVNMQIAPGFVQRVQRTCSHCGGSGKIIKHKCPKCGGEGVHMDRSQISTIIPKGVKDGERVVLEGQGHQIVNHPPGDIVVTFQIARHSKFTRHGMDLHYTLSVTLKEALLGFQKYIKHLDGRSVKLESDSIQGCTSLITIQGEGMCDTHGRCGNLVVSFNIKYPKRFTDSQKSEVQPILGASTEPKLERNLLEPVIYTDPW